MQKMKRNLGLALSTLIAFGGLGFSLAQAQTQPATAAPNAEMHKAGGHKGCDKGHHGKRGGEYKKMMDSLNLTPEQKTKLKAAREQFKQAHAGEMAALKAKREQLRQLGDNPANQQQRDQLRAELKSSWQSLRAERKASMQGILTPEQSAKMEAMKQEFHKNHPYKKQGNAS